MFAGTSDVVYDAAPDEVGQKSWKIAEEGASEAEADAAEVEEARIAEEVVEEAWIAEELKLAEEVVEEARIAEELTTDKDILGLHATTKLIIDFFSSSSPN